MTRSQNSDGRPQFHLRRISHRTLSTAANTVCFSNRITFIGRGDNVHYLVSSAAWQQRIFLSRRHCRLVRSEADDSHRLIDSSMTGVYVNDVKIAGSCVLEEGDVVTFGHPKGDTIQAGTRVRQPDSEHQFVFEACSCTAENSQQDVVQAGIHKRHKQFVGAAPTTPEMLGTFRVPKTVPKRKADSPAVVTHGCPTPRGGASVGSCHTTPPSSRRRPQTRSQGRVAKNAGSRSSTRPSIMQKDVGIQSNESSDTDTETGLTNERSLAKGKPSEKDERKLVQDTLGQRAKQSVQAQSPAEPPEPPSCNNQGQNEVSKVVSDVHVVDTTEEDYPLDLTLKYGQTSFDKEVDHQEVSQNGGELQVHTPEEKLISTENTDNSSKVVKQPDECSQEPTSSVQATVDEQKEGMQQTAQFDDRGNVREEPSKQTCLDERDTDTFAQQGQLDRDSAKEVVEKEPAVEIKAGGDVKEDGCSPVLPAISSKDAVEDTLVHSVQSTEDSLPDQSVLSKQNEEQTQDIHGLVVNKAVSRTKTMEEPVCVPEHKLDENKTFQTISEYSTSCEEEMQDAANRCDDPYMKPVGMSVEDHCCLQKKENTDVLSEKQEMNETFPDKVTDFPDVDATVKSPKPVEDISSCKRAEDNVPVEEDHSLEKKEIVDVLTDEQETKDPFADKDTDVDTTPMSPQPVKDSGLHPEDRGAVEEDQSLETEEIADVFADEQQTKDPFEDKKTDVDATAMSPQPVEDNSLQTSDNGSVEEDHSLEKKEIADVLTDEQEIKDPFADKPTDVDATAMSPKPVEDDSKQAEDNVSIEKGHSLEKKEIADVLTDEQETKDPFEDKKTDVDATAMSPKPVEDGSLQTEDNGSIKEDYSLEKKEIADVLSDEQETKDPFEDKKTDKDTIAMSPQPVKDSCLQAEDCSEIEEDHSLEKKEIADICTDEQQTKDPFADKNTDVDATAMSPKPVEDSSLQTEDNGSIKEDYSLEKKEIADVLTDEQQTKDPFADKPTCTDVDATAMTSKPVENSGIQTHDNRSILDVTVSLADEADYPVQIENKPSIADETQAYSNKTLVEGSTSDNADCSLDQTLASEKYKQVLQEANKDEQDLSPTNPSSQMEEKEIDVNINDLTNAQDKNMTASQSGDKTLPEVDNKVTNPILTETAILITGDLKSHVKVSELVQSLEKSDPPCNKSAIGDTAVLVSEEDMPVTDGMDKEKDDEDAILSHTSQDSSITPSPRGGESHLQVKDKCDHPVSIEPASVDDEVPSISPPSPVEEDDEDVILSHASQDSSITPSPREGEGDLQVVDKCDHPVSIEPANVDDEDLSISPPSPVEEDDEDVILSHASQGSSITPSLRQEESDLQVRDKCDHPVSMEPASVDDEDPSISPPSPVIERLHEEGITNTAMDDSTAWVLQEFEDLERSLEIPPVINAKNASQDLSQSSFMSSVPSTENEKEMIPSSQGSDREFDSGESYDSHMGILRLSPSGRSGDNATQSDVESEDMETPLSQNSTGSDFGLSGVVPFVASPTGSQEDSLEALQKEAFAEMEANEDSVTLSTSCLMQNKDATTSTSDGNVITGFKKSVTWEVTDTGLDTDAKENDDLSMDDLEEEFGDGNSRFVVSDSIDYRAEDDNYSSDSDGSSSDEEDLGKVGGAGLGLHLSDSEVETEDRIHSSQSVSLHEEHSSHGHVQNVKDQSKSVSGPLEESKEEKKEDEASDSSGVETILSGNFQETSTQLAKPVEERKEVLPLDEIPADDASSSKVLPSQETDSGKLHNISEEEDVAKETETEEKSQMVALPDVESKLPNPTLAESTILEIGPGKLHNISEEIVAKKMEAGQESQIVTSGTSMEIQSSQEQQDQDKANSGECDVSNPCISQAVAIDPPHKESGPKRQLNVESKDENSSGKQQCEDRVKIYSQIDQESAVVDDQLTSEDSEASEVLPSAKRPHDENDAVLPQSKILHLDSQLEETDMIEAEGLNVIDITSEGLENIPYDSMCGTVDSFDVQREVSKSVNASDFQQMSLPIISVKSRADCVRDAVLDFFAHRFFLDKMSSKLDKIAEEARKQKVAEEVKAFFASRSLKEPSTSTDRQGCVEPEIAPDSNSSSAKKGREDPTCKDIPSLEVDKKKVIERAVYEFFKKKNFSAMKKPEDTVSGKTENKVQTQPKKRHSNEEQMLENSPEAKRQKLQEVSEQHDGLSSSNTPDVKRQILQEASQQPNVCTDTTQEVNNSQDAISVSENQEFKTLANIHEDSKAKTNQGEQNTTLGHDKTEDNTKVCCLDNKGLETYNTNDKDRKETDMSGEMNVAMGKDTSDKDGHELEISTEDMDIQPEQDNKDKEMVDVQDMEVCSSTESDSKALDQVVHVVASENEANNCISSASYSAEENFETSEKSNEKSPTPASEEEIVVPKTLPQDNLSGKVTMTASPKCQITETATSKDYEEKMSDTTGISSPNEIKAVQCLDMTEVPSNVNNEVMQSDLTEIEETSHEKPPSSSQLDNSTSPSSHSKETDQTSQESAVQEVCNEVDVQEDSETDANSDLSLPSLDGYAESESDRDSNYSENETFLSPNPMDSYDESSDAESDRDSNNSENDRFLPSYSMEYGAEFDSDENVDVSDQDDKEDDSSDDNNSSNDDDTSEDDDDDKDGDSSDPESLTSTPAEKTNISSKDCPDTEQDSSVESPKAATSDKLADTNEDVTMETDKQSNEMALQGLSCDFDDDDEFSAPNINLDDIDFDDDNFDDDSPSIQTSSDLPSAVTNFSPGKDISVKENRNRSAVSEMAEREKSKKITNVAPTEVNPGLGTSRESAGNTTTTKTTPAVQSTKVSSGKDTKDKTPGVGKDKAQTTEETPGVLPTNAGKTRRRLVETPGKVTTDNAPKYMEQCQAIMSSLQEALDKEPSLKDISRVQAWKKEAAKLGEKMTLPETIIAVVGDTGAGKSSLMNALLDHSSVLPTSGMRACTAVVVEVSNNERNKNYEADVEFLSRKEWDDELRLLLTDLIGEDGKAKRKPDPQSEAGIAWSKIKAVYGRVESYDVLSRLPHVRHLLGTTKHISKSRAREFRSEIDKYVDSMDAPPTRGPGSRDRSGGQLWPIVKRVKVQIPNCDVCSSGAILVDLPGVRDSNAARDNIAKQYFKNCNAIWIVASIHRAVDDKTAKELLGEGFRRQLLMDGQYGSIAFICTKTDDLRCSEIIRALNLEEEVEQFENEINALEVEKMSITEELDSLKEEEEEKDDELAAIQQEVNDLKEEVFELEQTVEPVDVTPDEEVIVDDDDREKLNSLRTTLEEKQSAEQEKKADLKETRSQIADKEKEIAGVERQVCSKQRQMSVMCAKARNQYSQTQIRADFKAGIREMKRKAGMMGEDADSDDDDEEEEVEDQEEEDIARGLRVFTVSSTEYLKLTNKLTRDGPAQVFSSVHDTQIPALRQFVHEMTNVRRKSGTEKLIRSLGSFVSDIASYLLDEGTKNHGTRMSAKTIFEHHLGKLKTSLEPVLGTLQTDVDRSISICIQPKLKEGVQAAASMCQAVAKKWGAPTCKENRQAGGLHYSTYKATVRRSGVYKSPTYGPIDMNEDLSSPLYNTITISWQKVFDNGTLFFALDNCKQSVLRTLKDFLLKLRTELQALGMDADRVNRVGQQQLNSTKMRLDNAVAELKEFITGQQREISRVMTPAVQNRMEPVYETCTNESGPGSFNRMRNHMDVHVEYEKDVMFDQASQFLLKHLADLEVDIVARMQVLCDQLCDDLAVLYEPFWEAPVHCTILKKHLMDDMLSIHGKVKALFEDADLQDLPPLPEPAPQPAAVNQSTIHAGYSPMNRPGSSNMSTGTTPTGINSMVTPTYPLTLRIKQELMDMHSCGAATPPNQRFHFGGIRPPTQSFHFGGIRPPPVAGAMTAPASAVAGTRSGPCASGVGTPVPANIQSHQASANTYVSQPRIKREQDSHIGRAGSSTPLLNPAAVSQFRKRTLQGMTGPGNSQATAPPVLKKVKTEKGYFVTMIGQGGQILRFPVVQTLTQMQQNGSSQQTGAAVRPSLHRSATPASSHHTSSTTTKGSFGGKTGTQLSASPAPKDFVSAKSGKVSVPTYSASKPVTSQGLSSAKGKGASSNSQMQKPTSGQKGFVGKQTPGKGGKGKGARGMPATVPVARQHGGPAVRVKQEPRTPLRENQSRKKRKFQADEIIDLTLDD